jgi:hypothetical protein
MRHLLPLAVGALLAWGGVALADPAVGPPAAPASAGPGAAAPPTAVPASGRKPSAVLPQDQRIALSEADLAALSGGEKITVSLLSNQQLTGTTTGNTITADTLNTGAITFGQQALGNYAGVGNFVINTGANNTLQGAINISIITTPGSP